jgi:hypothetical protein
MPSGDDAKAPEAAPVVAGALALGTAATTGAAATDRDDSEPSLVPTSNRGRTAPSPRQSRPARVVRSHGRVTPEAAPRPSTAATGADSPQSNAAADTQSELRDWIKENATLLSNASLLISLAAIALNLLPNAGFLDPYIKGLIFGAALLLLIELHHQWPDDLQLHVLRTNIRPANHSWRMTGFALLMQVATLVFAVWAILSNPLILVPLTALGIVLAFRQWYFRRFGGVFAKSIGILALIAVLVITELFLLVIWEATSQGDVTFEVWLDERARPEAIP